MSVFGIDFGNLNSTVAITRYGGVDIVVNEVSKRETTTIVSFLDDERFIGEQGLDRYVRNAQNTVFLLKRFIGMRMSDPNLDAERRFLTCAIKGDDAGRLMFGVMYCGEMHYFYPEQVLAMMLQKLRTYVNDAATVDARFPADVRDCVTTVPAYYTAEQRRLMYQACEVAGINCMTLINETTASALDYGIFRGPSLKETEEEGQIVGILDIGYGASDFSITKFWRGNCKVLARSFDRHNGTREVDYAIYKHMVEEVKNKYKIDVTENRRARLRLLQACERLKYLLSGNSSAPLHLENLMDVDVSIPNFERATMESLSKDMLDRTRAIVERCLATAGIQPSQLHSIEMIGGGCRIPMLKALIEEILGRPPSFTLNASETTARGCAIMAAMLSPKFQVREFKVFDLPTYPILLGYTVENPKSPCSLPFLPDVNKVVTLLGSTDNYPKLLDVTIPRAGPLKVYAFYDPENANVRDVVLDNGYVIGEWEVGTPTGKPTGEVRGREVRVRVNLSFDGLVTVDAAHAIETFEVEETEVKPAAEGEEPEKVVSKKRKHKTIEVSIRPNLQILGHGSESILAFLKHEKDMFNRDEQIVRTREKKNELESYILDYRPRMSEGGILYDYTLPEQRASFIQMCTEGEEWLYGDGDQATFEAYKEHIDALRLVGDAAHSRLRNREDVEFAVKGFDTSMLQAQKLALDKVGKTAHITEEELRAAAATAEEAMVWAKSQLEALLASPKTETPSFTPHDLETKSAAVLQGIRAIVNRPAPPPPKKEPKKDEAAKSEEAAGTSHAKEAEEAEEAEEAKDEEAQAELAPEA